MLTKILICRCYKEKFHEVKEEYVKKLIHFHCKCKEKHLLLVCLCDEQPYGSNLPEHAEKECKCASAPAKDFCDFCRWVSDLLNFKVYKICVKCIPKSLKDNTITTY